jgi:hypothetical protein
MEVEMEGLMDPGEESAQLMVNPNTGGFFKRKSSAAKVSVTFTGQDPPEGYARIDNQLIKLLP